MFKGNGCYRELLLKLYYLKGGDDFTLKEVSSSIPEYTKPIHYRLSVVNAIVKSSNLAGIQKWKLADSILTELKSLSINMGGNIPFPDTV